MSETTTATPRKRRSIFGELTTSNEDGLFIVKYPPNYHEELIKERISWEELQKQAAEKLKSQKQRLKSLQNSELTPNDLNKIDVKYRKLLLEFPNFDRFKTITQDFLKKQIILTDMKRTYEQSLEELKRATK